MLAGMPYEALYVEHEPAARRLALTLVPPHAAEDVVSEAFTRVLDTAVRNGPPEAFGPYLLRAVRNTALRYRDQGRRLVPVPDPEPAPAAGPDAIVSDREDARLAAAAFRRLPERWRQVLWATAVEEITIAALANRWGMTANGVSQLASRAREGLRQGYLTEHLGAAQGRACREVAPYMGAAVRGRAGRRRQQQLAAHLRGCERCGQAYAGLGALNARLGELLVPAAAGAGAALTRVLPAARAVTRGFHLHAGLLTAGVAASVAGAATFTLAVPHHGQAVIPAAAPAPSATVQASAGAGTGPVTAVPLSSGGTGLPAPGAAGSVVSQAAGTVTRGAGQVASAAGRTVTQAGQAAGTLAASTGQAAGQAVTGVTSQAASTAAGTGQAAGGAVSGVAGTAGNLVQSVTGTAGSVLGGL
jgi:RNA polymerase sigma factor (sigma-70 family)